MVIKVSITDVKWLILLCRLGVQGTPMSGTDIEDVKEQDLNDGILKDQVDSDLHAEDSKHLDENEENPMPSTQQEVYLCIYLSIYLYIYPYTYI